MGEGVSSITKSTENKSSRTNQGTSTLMIDDVFRGLVTNIDFEWKILAALKQLQINQGSHKFCVFQKT